MVLPVLVIEHPTEDFKEIDPASLDKIASDIRQKIEKSGNRKCRN